MSKKKQKDTFDKINKVDLPEDIMRIDERRFSQKLEELVLVAEEMRIKRMRQHRTRGFIAINFSLLAATIGAAGFGWFFLIKLNIPSALICVAIPLFLSAIAYFWSALPIKTYKQEHKMIFMPKLAQALSGLSYHPRKGINIKILNRALVLPQHNKMNSEDCFMGTYKGVKVIFSEARLYSNVKRDGPVFQGIFVLLEVPGEVIEGHTVVSADQRLIQANIKTRWKSMKRVYISPSNPEWDIFHVYSTNPDTAELMIGDRLLKELAEASAIFNHSHLTAVLFGKKYVFMMVPNNHDMFEPSDLYVPITTHQHAINCKREIEQLLEIIDVFDLYKPLTNQ